MDEDQLKADAEALIPAFRALIAAGQQLLAGIDKLLSDLPGPAQPANPNPNPGGPVPPAA